MSVLQFIAGHFWCSGMEAIFRIPPHQLVMAQPFIAGAAQCRYSTGGISGPLCSMPVDAGRDQCPWPSSRAGVAPCWQQSPFSAEVPGLWLLSQEIRGSRAALAALGRTDGVRCSRSRAPGAPQPGEGLQQLQKGSQYPCLERGGEAESPRSLPESVSNSCSSTFFCPQSSLSLAEIAAFAVAQSDQMALPCGQIWLAHCHMAHTHLRCMSKKRVAFLFRI